jgi:hypothetical protein
MKNWLIPGGKVGWMPAEETTGLVLELPATGAAALVLAGGAAAF